MDADQDALQYDKNRRYSTTTIRLIQRAVGATVDGEWSPETVEAVRAWQARHGLPADGRVGAVTLRAILTGGSDEMGSVFGGVR